MNRNIKAISCTFAAALTLAGAFSTSALADSDTTRRTATGAVVGGVVVGVASGSAGWAAAGAVAGGAGGYLYDKNKKKEENAAKDSESNKSK
jgi:uncharacterized protein YcfJ